MIKKLKLKKIKTEYPETEFVVYSISMIPVFILIVLLMIILVGGFIHYTEILKLMGIDKIGFNIMAIFSSSFLLLIFICNLIYKFKNRKQIFKEIK